MYRPLADDIRPTTLDDVVGQKHILGPNGMLRRIVASGEIPNMVFYGPSGTGKTTVASIIAASTNRTLRRLNATTASISDIRNIIAELDTMLTPGGVLLYLDEIQYFNKKQQQSLLEFMEDGRITVIASTTENPYFYVYNAVLSRSTVFEFKQVPAAEVEKAVLRAVSILCERENVTADIEPGTAGYIASVCGGDVRKALNTVELLFSAAPRDGAAVQLLRADAENITQRSAMHYDRAGDDHFDVVSALMKSLRGSDPDAALHYLARLLEAGDLIGACRRILCSASEDIGLAYPQAAMIVKSCVDSALQLGLPEARLPLAEAVLLLATAPKSNSVVMSIDAAIADVRAGKAGPIPRELQNVHADGTGFEREQGYKYPHSYPGHWVQQQYLLRAQRKGNLPRAGKLHRQRSGAVAVVPLADPRAAKRRLHAVWHGQRHPHIHRLSVARPGQFVIAVRAPRAVFPHRRGGQRADEQRAIIRPSNLALPARHNQGDPPADLRRFARAPRRFNPPDGGIVAVRTDGRALAVHRRIRKRHAPRLNRVRVCAQHDFRKIAARSVGSRQAHFALDRAQILGRFQTDGHRVPLGIGRKRRLFQHDGRLRAAEGKRAGRRQRDQQRRQQQRVFSRKNLHDIPPFG